MSLAEFEQMALGLVRSRAGTLEKPDADRERWSSPHL
jgi:hypothetical protein